MLISNLKRLRRIPALPRQSPDTNAKHAYQPSVFEGSVSRGTGKGNNTKGSGKGLHITLLSRRGTLISPHLLHEMAFKDQGSFMN